MLTPTVRRLAAVATLLGLSSSGCRHRYPQSMGSSTEEYAGLYNYDFEVSRFEPCARPAGDSPWWIVLSDRAVSTRDSLARAGAASPGRDFFVRWRGWLSDTGTVGHLGKSRRYLTVDSILEWRPLRASDCRQPFPLSSVTGRSTP